MKIVQLDPKNVDYFGEMDYFDNLSCLVHPGSFALGATKERENGSDEPAALLVVDAEEDIPVIRWLYVKSNCRGEGIGSRLLYMCFKEAMERNMKRVLVRVSEEYLEAAPEWDPERFFMECLFKDEESVMKEYVLFAKELMASAAVKKTASENSLVMPLSDLAKEKKESVYMQLGKDATCNCDEELSYVFIKKGELEAALFMRSYGKVIYPILLYGKDTDHKKTLIRAILCNVRELDPEEVLRIGCKSIAGEEIMETMGLPKKEYMISYREAKMEAFKELLKVEGI